MGDDQHIHPDKDINRWLADQVDKLMGGELQETVEWHDVKALVLRVWYKAKESDHGSA